MNMMHQPAIPLLPSPQQENENAVGSAEEDVNIEGVLKTSFFQSISKAGIEQSPLLSIIVVVQF
jgi:hypothetical protein